MEWKETLVKIHQRNHRIGWGSSPHGQCCKLIIIKQLACCNVAQSEQNREAFLGVKVAKCESYFFNLCTEEHVT